MKYVFATVLVLVALVMVFNADKLIPVPRAVSGWLLDTGGKFLPFSAKTAYVESCLEESRQEHFTIRHKVSETAVRIGDLNAEAGKLDQARRARLQRIDVLVKQGQTNSPELAVQVQAFEQLNRRYENTAQIRDRHVSAYQSLQAAEHNTADHLDDLRQRLELVKVEHLRHNALEMASAGGAYGVNNAVTCTQQGGSVVSTLEFDERVRDDLYHRYAAQPEFAQDGEPRPDPAATAQALLACHQALLN